MSSKVWDKITYPLPNFNSCTVLEWLVISSHILQLLIYAEIKFNLCWQKGSEGLPAMENMIICQPAATHWLRAQLPEDTESTITAHAQKWIANSSLEMRVTKNQQEMFPLNESNSNAILQV